MQEESEWHCVEEREDSCLQGQSGAQDTGEGEATWKLL